MKNSFSIKIFTRKYSGYKNLSFSKWTSSIWWYLNKVLKYLVLLYNWKVTERIKHDIYKSNSKLFYALKMVYSTFGYLTKNIEWLIHFLCTLFSYTCLKIHFLSFKSERICQHEKRCKTHYINKTLIFSKSLYLLQLLFSLLYDFEKRQWIFE